MRLPNFSGPVDNQRLGGMECGVVGGPRRDIGQGDADDLACVTRALFGGPETASALWIIDLTSNFISLTFGSG
jgi:hypothetical protein